MREEGCADRQLQLAQNRVRVCNTRHIACGFYFARPVSPSAIRRILKTACHRLTAADFRVYDACLIFPHFYEANFIHSRTCPTLPRQRNMHT